MRRSPFSEEQSIGMLRLAEAGQTVAEAGQTVAEVCRQHGISAGTSYRREAQYGGLEVSQLRRRRQSGEENRRLEQVVADLTPDHTALREIATQNG